MDGSPTPNTVQLSVSGMTCGGCASRVQRTILSAPGVVDASVNLVMETATVSFNADEFDASALTSLVTDAGYPAAYRDTDAVLRQRQDAAHREAEGRQLRYDLIILLISIALSLPLLMMMVLPPMGVGYALPAWAQMALATPIQFWVGAKFYVGAWHALRSKSGNMDVLVAVGTSAAYGLSTWIAIDQGFDQTAHLYFEASALVITLVVAGKLLESYAKRGTAQAIRSLMELRPNTARVLKHGVEEMVAVAEVQIDDVVLVRPGERIPVDGDILNGATEIDESMMTGESRAVAKSVGDPVIGGALNGSGVIEVRTSKVGADTTLAKIIKLVENAQSGKAPMQRLVDQISHIFVPIVMVISAVTLIGWLIAGIGMETAIINAVSVLVIACPCALGLATPSAIVAGTGAAARAGVLIKDIAALEIAHNVDTVAFDKTGTLTLGAPRVQAIHAFGADEAHLLTVAASVQQHSEHPLASAITVEAGNRDIRVEPATEVQAHVGQGISGRFQGHHIRIGNAGLMTANNISVADFEGVLSELESDGLTPIYIAEDDAVIGLIGVADGIRPEAPSGVAMLHHQGIRTMMLSGDTLSVAQKIASEIGVSDVRAGLKPDQKLDVIDAVQDDGRVVAMVGDGINDAPALAGADVAIAMGTGTDVAMETAGITLMRPDPRLVAAAIDISRKTWMRIKWNLFWAFIFNVVGLPLAALGYLSPVVAGTAMALSSITVVSNSLLLRRWKPDGLN